MTAMATATFSDGSIPDVNDVALLAANLFAGGQETTVRLLSFALRIIAERPDIQKAPARTTATASPTSSRRRCAIESPLRAQFRMARAPVTVGGVDIPAGGTVMLLPGAANRDPRTFPDPDRVRHRPGQRPLHIAFGHGIHHCAGAHLARAEGRVSVNRLLDRTADITHLRGGPRAARRPPLRLSAHVLSSGAGEASISSFVPA